MAPDDTPTYYHKHNPRGSITRQFLERMLGKLEYNKHVAIAASQYYERKSNELYLPAITIGALGGLLNVMLPSLVAAPQLVICNAVVGTLIWIGTYLQTLLKNLKYGPMAEKFAGAAEQYDDLITKVHFEIYDPDEPDFIKKLENKILEVQKQCKYRAPLFILEKYQ